MEVNRKLLAVIAVVIVVAALGYYYYFMQGGPGSVEAKAESGNSETGVTARPYIDYKTDDGRILRVYLDDGSKWWVNPDGTLTPYSERMLVWTVPGTLTKINQIQVGFDLQISGKYLKDTDGNGQQDITVFVTAYFKSNSTGQYSVFSNQRFDYEVGDPSTGGSITQTIQSGYKDIQTIYDSVWGGTPGQDYIYWPFYYVEISVNATSYWGGTLSASDSKTYDHTVIGDWQWKQSELSASLGSATAGTQSIIDVSAVQDPFAVMIIAGVVLTLALVFYDAKKRAE